MNDYITKEEVWKPVNVEGFENCYEVSNKGNVRSLDRVVRSKRGNIRYRGKLLKTTLNSDGYPTCNLCYAGRKKNVKVHRLVANSFLPNHDNLEEVNHIDENKANNHVENLEWCTRKENMNHGTGIERMMKHPNQLTRREKSKKKIVGVSVEGGKVIEFESISEADRKGYPRRNVWSALNGTDATCKGFVWLYEEDYNKSNVESKLERTKQKVVASVDDHGNVLKIIGSVKKASKEIGVDRSNITRACNTGRRTKGHKLKYV